jgi:hypothetical protein
MEPASVISLFRPSDSERSGIVMEIAAVRDILIRLLWTERHDFGIRERRLGPMSAEQ